jgi:hypothetical protein
LFGFGLSSPSCSCSDDEVSVSQTLHPSPLLCAGCVTPAKASVLSFTLLEPCLTPAEASRRSSESGKEIQIPYYYYRTLSFCLLSPRRRTGYSAALSEYPPVSTPQQSVCLLSDRSAALDSACRLPCWITESRLRATRRRIGFSLLPPDPKSASLQSRQARMLGASKVRSLPSSPF